MKDLIQKLLLLACFGFSLSTNASLIGDTADCATTGVGIACSSTTATVEDGLEFTIDDSNSVPIVLSAPIALTVPTALAVPEPTTIALLGLSLIGLVGLKFAREKKKSDKTRKNKK